MSELSETEEPDSPCGWPLMAAVRPAIETRRLILRPPIDDDAETIAQLANSATVARNLVGMPHPYRIEHARAWLAEPVSGTSSAARASTQRQPPSAFSRLTCVGASVRDGSAAGSANAIGDRVTRLKLAMPRSIMPFFTNGMRDCCLPAGLPTRPDDG